jgi:hypothetical protein
VMPSMAALAFCGPNPSHTFTSMTGILTLPFHREAAKDAENQKTCALGC